MAVSYVSKTITQYEVIFSIDDDERVDVFLTYNYGWKLTISDPKKITIMDLIEICELLYSERILESNAVITVHLRGVDPIYVRGEDAITDAFIKGISVEPLDTTAK